MPVEPEFWALAFGVLAVLTASTERTCHRPTVSAFLSEGDILQREASSSKSSKPEKPWKPSWKQG